MRFVIDTVAKLQVTLEEHGRLLRDLQHTVNGIWTKLNNEDKEDSDEESSMKIHLPCSTEGDVKAIEDGLIDKDYKKKMVHTWRALKRHYINDELF